MSLSRVPVVLLAALLLLAGLVVPARAGQPTDDLRSYVDRVVAVLDDPAMKGPDHAADRQRAVKTVADEGLDLQEAARRTLGQYWDARTAAERTRFTELFTALIYAGYLSKVAGYDGERITYDRETAAGDEAVVQARVIAKDGDVTPVEFRLVRTPGGRWRVWDASFEGMSLVGNYRAQFARIIRSTSYGELIKRLEARTHPTK